MIIFVTFVAALGYAVSAARSTIMANEGTLTIEAKPHRSRLHSTAPPKFSFTSSEEQRTGEHGLLDADSPCKILQWVVFDRRPRIC